MFNKIKKQKRGFSLVELMVVVAIMGTLSAIAIPAYNNYRQSAKKNAYRTDLTSLHKSWLAFGVELDSFCERDTDPENASITAVGMASLTTSKLYGANNAATPASCSSGTPTPASCNVNSSECTGCTGSGILTPYSPAGNGPGKHNFIGFADAAGCTNVTNDSDVQILGEQSGSATNSDGTCDLGITSYDMGVYGHLSGENFYGVSINNNGVLSAESDTKPTNSQNAQACTPIT